MTNGLFNKSKIKKQTHNQHYSIGYSYFNIPIFPVNPLIFNAHKFFLKIYAKIKLNIPKPILIVNKIQLIFILLDTIGKITAAPTHPAPRFIKKSAKIPKAIPSISRYYRSDLSLSI